MSRDVQWSANKHTDTPEKKEEKCGVCMKWPPLSLEIGFDAEYTEIISNKHNAGGSLGKEKVM